MKSKKSLILFLIVLFHFPISAQHVEHVKLSSYYIPGLVENNGTGIMIDMLKRIEQEQHIVFDLTIMPTARVQHGFKQNKIYGYFPELEEFQPENSCRTAAFMQKKIITITLAQAPVIKNVKALEGKRVGAVTGYSYGENIVGNPNIEIQRVADDKANLRKLLSGRIDVILGDGDSTVNAIKELSIADKVNFDVAEPINLLDVFFVFPEHSFGKLNCDMVSKGIEKLRSRGELLTWFGYQ